MQEREGGTLLRLREHRFLCRIRRPLLNTKEPRMMHDWRCPGGSDQYRQARDELLEAEVGLRRQIESVAAQRRKLPLGGLVPTDYVFEEWDAGKNALRHVRLSELFEDGKDTLFVYSHMVIPGKQGLPLEEGCPSCTSIIDGMDGSAPRLPRGEPVRRAASDGDRFQPPGRKDPSHVEQRADHGPQRSRTGHAPRRLHVAALVRARPHAGRPWGLVCRPRISPECDLAAGGGGSVDRRQGGLELVAQAFKLRRQDEAFAQVRGILVDRKARTHRRDLEQHATWFAKVHGLEPIAVDHRRRLSAGRNDALAPRHLLVVKRRPGNVMHRADPGPAALRGSNVVHVASGPTFPASLPRHVSDSREPQRALEQLAARFGIGGVRAHLFESLDRVLGRYLGMRRRQWGVSRLHHTKLQPKTLRVGEQKRSVRPHAIAQASLPEVERVLGADTKDDPVNHAPPRSARTGPRILEEGQVQARAAVVVAVEKVVNGRVVLVDSLLDQPQSQRTGVEEI